MCIRQFRSKSVFPAKPAVSVCFLHSREKFIHRARKAAASYTDILIFVFVKGSKITPTPNRAYNNKIFVGIDARIATNPRIAAYQRIAAVRKITIRLNPTANISSIYTSARYIDYGSDSVQYCR